MQNALTITFGEFVEIIDHDDAITMQWRSLVTNDLLRNLTGVEATSLGDAVVLAVDDVLNWCGSKMSRADEHLWSRMYLDACADIERLLTEAVDDHVRENGLQADAFVRLNEEDIVAVATTSYLLDRLRIQRPDLADSLAAVLYEIGLDGNRAAISLPWFYDRLVEQQRLDMMWKTSMIEDIGEMIEWLDGLIEEAQP